MFTSKTSCIVIVSLWVIALVLSFSPLRMFPEWIWAALAGFCAGERMGRLVTGDYE